MEKDKNNHENEDDELEALDHKSKHSKSNSKESKSEETTEIKPERPRKLASFFLNKEVFDKEKLEIESENNQDEEPNLTEEEVHEVTLAIIDSLIQEVNEELNSTEPDSTEEFIALSDAVFLEELLEIAVSDEDITVGSIERAFQETVEDLSLVESTELEDVDTVIDSEYNEDIASLETDDIDQLAVPTSPPPALPPGLYIPIAPNNQAPTSPVPPINNYQNQNNNNINQINAVSAPNTVVETVEIIHGRRSDMLVGAIIGYIVGRRGGRKRAEKKLLPKINNLEKQVIELQDNIIEKEVLIRKIAKQNMDKIDNSSNKTTVTIERRKAKKEVKEKLKRREELSKDPSVEKIGKFSLPALKVFHERRLPDGNENNPKRKQVEIMTESELLDKISGLKIHGLNVANMYQRKRLTLKSLRQITKEFLRGGDFKQTFTLELLQDEQELYEKRTRVNVARLSGNEKAVTATENSSLNNNVDIEKANKMAEALLMTHSQTSTSSGNKKYIISGVITGIIVVCIMFVMLLLN